MVSNLAVLHNGFLMGKDNKYLPKSDRSLGRDGYFVVDVKNTSTLNRVRARRGYKIVYFFLWT